MLTLTFAHSHDVTLSTRLVIQVFHRSQTKKKHRKRSLVGSANVSLSEFLNRNPLPHRRPVDFDVRLSCPPPQRKSPTIGGRQQHNATLTMRFHVPHQENVDESPPMSPVSDHHETDGLFSEGMLSDGAFCTSLYPFLHRAVLLIRLVQPQKRSQILRYSPHLRG